MFENMFEFSVIDEESDFLPIMSFEDEEGDQKLDQVDSNLPLLPLKNMLLFPTQMIPVTVGRQKSLQAVIEAEKGDRFIAVVAQKDPSTENPIGTDLYELGTIAKVMKIIKMQSGTSTVILQGRERCKIKHVEDQVSHLRAEVELEPDVPCDENDPEFKALISSVKELALRIINLSPNIPNEANLVLENIDQPGFLIHFISSNLNVSVAEKQSILAISDLKIRVQEILKSMDTELQLLELKDQIQNKVRSDIEKQQRDYFLHQQLKTIHDELGSDSPDSDLEDLVLRAREMNWPSEVDEKFHKELKRVKRMNPVAAEYSVTMNYLELLLDLPWGQYTEDNFDLQKAKGILDRDHFGLHKVKKRILEYLAVLKLKKDMKSPILCLVGPPGVGKTSLGKSIAEAVGRKYVRMSLGGLHDESEIRGHRKTYIGAMPGRIIQSIKKVKSSNPVFILDEIDKVGNSFRGDPSSALLEVLDPEQNDTFHDKFLGVDFDLSSAMFIATANSLGSIQPALRDRMEIIDISGYSLEEKVQIAKKHLIPKQRKEHGLLGKHVKVSDKTLMAVGDRYTRESGVRDFERKIGSLMRYVAKSVAMEEDYVKNIKPEHLNEILGPSRFDPEMYVSNNPAGVAIGLAWTPVGGDILFIETSASKGKGQLTLTGNLGDVMKESATTALSFIRANADSLGLDEDRLAKLNIHIHIPEGAIPKDGPSAGITMLTALTSLLTGRKVKPYLAMTGEITLRGKVLPVGGIKEKMLAARRAGIKNVILSKVNERNILELEQDSLKGLKFIYVEDMHEVLDHGLEKEKRSRVGAAGLASKN